MYKGHVVGIKSMSALLKGQITKNVENVTYVKNATIRLRKKKSIMIMLLSVSKSKNRNA